jgi:hypothetical protein
VNVSSSDTEAALELLTLEAGREISSWPSLDDMQGPSLSSSAGSEWFEDWPEANDMVASVYVLLTAETSCTRQEQEDASRQSPGRSCSCVPKVDSASGDQRPSHRGAVGRKPHAGGSVGGERCDRAQSPTRTCDRRSTGHNPSCKKSNKSKKPLAADDVATPSLAHELLLGDFDKYTWEIMYPRFVESRLVAPPERTDD